MPLGFAPQLPTPLLLSKTPGWVDKNELKSKNWDRVEGMALRKSGVAVLPDMGLWVRVI